MRNKHSWQLLLISVSAAAALSGCRLAPSLATAEKIKALHPEQNTANTFTDQQDALSEQEDLLPEEGNTELSEDLEAVTEEGLTEDMSEGMIGVMIEDTADAAADMINSSPEIAEVLETIPVSGTSDSPSESAFRVQNVEHLIPGAQLLKKANLTAPEKNLNMLQIRLQNRLAQAEGTWSVCVYDLSTDETFTINDTSMPSASLMKLFILGCAYDEIHKGNITRTSELVAQMSGMIRVSSNEDANHVIAALGGGDYKTGIRRINQYIRVQGYSENTILYNPFQNEALIFDSEHSNQTTARDCVELFYRIYHRTFSNRKDCNETEDWLLGQSIRYKLPSIAPEGVTIGNKTGETDTIENDTAIFYTPKGDYIVSVLSTDWTNKNAAQTTIKEISAEIYKYFSNEDYSATDFFIPKL